MLYSRLHRSPEAFDIVPKTMNLSAGKKNLAQISKVLTQIMNGSEFGDDKSTYVPINDFVRKAIQQITAWLIEGKSVLSSMFSVPNRVRSGFRSRCRITIPCARVFGRHCATEAYLYLTKRDLYYSFVTSSTPKIPGPFFVLPSILLSENKISQQVLMIQ